MATGTTPPSTTSTARNRGLRCSTGQLLCYIRAEDADRNIPDLMTRHQILLQLACLAIAILIAPSAQAADIDERKWILIESENFAVRSSLSEGKTKDLMNHLEALRGVFADSVFAAEGAVEKQTDIFVFGRGADYEAMGLSDTTAGLFKPELRKNYVFIRNTGSMLESQVILHEYVHYIMQATSRFPYPLWWKEGFSEYVSASRLSRKHFSIGVPLPGRIDMLTRYKWLPWEAILNPTNYSEYTSIQRSLFYAQSWLLVHFLHNRHDRSVSVSRSWQIYHDRVLAGRDPVAAFAKGFGISRSDLKAAVEFYFRKGNYTYWRIPRKDVLDEQHLSVSRISQTDIRIELGQVALRFDNEETARSWFEKVLENSSGHALALAGIALSYEQEGQYREAASYYQQALAVGADEPTVLIDAAKFVLDGKNSADISTNGYVDTIDPRQLLQKARRLAGPTAEIDTWLAVSYMVDDEDPAQAAQLLAGVVRRSPADQWPLLMLAQLFKNQGLTDNAIAMAELLLSSETHRNAYTTAARKLIAELGGSDPSSQSRPYVPAPVLPRKE